MNIRKLILSAALLLTLLAVVSCSGSGEIDVKLVDFTLSEDYVVMRSDMATPDEVDAAVELKGALADAGLERQLSTDWVKRGEAPPETAREILVGTTNRAESIEAKGALKRDDFTIGLYGERIVVIGGSEEATARAVEFFVTNCIGEGGLKLPETPYICRGEYKLDRITLNGRDIDEYSIVVSRGGNSELYASRIVNLVAELSGNLLDIAYQNDNVKTDAVIKLEKSNEEIGQVTVSDNEIGFSGGEKYGLMLAVNELTSKLSEKNGKELEIMLENKKIEAEVKPLVSTNLPTEYPAMKVEANTDGVMEFFLKAKAELPEEITVLPHINVEDYPYSLANTVYVSPDGDDSNDGTLESPLKTPNAALDKLKGAGGGVVYLREGSYTLTSSLNITASHSGTELSPLFISSYNGEKVSLTGGISIPADSFKAVTDQSILARLNKDAASKIMVADLTELGITSADIPAYTASVKPILFASGETQTLARYPNEGKELVMGEVVKIGSCTSKHSTLYGVDTTPGWEIKLTDKRALDWSDENEIWYYGAVYAEWEKRHYQVTIDTEKETIKSPVSNSYGARYVKDNTFWFYNVLEELDVPGEWYLDRKSCKLYYYPDGGLDSVSLVMMNSPIINSDGAENVVIRGLEVTGTMQAGIKFMNGYHNIVDDCIMYDCGANGVSINNCKESGVIYSTFSHNAASQCVITNPAGGSMVPDHCFIQNCTFKNPVVQTGASVGGVGYVVSHNYFDGTTVFVSLSNEAIFEYNDFNHGSLTTADSGMIYVNGHNPAGRGNHIRYNYFHDVKASHAGVYIDDCASGQLVYGNIVDFDGAVSGKQTYRTHNGRECVFWNNISINATSCAFGDNANYYNPTSIRWAAVRETMLSGGKKAVEHEDFVARYPVYIDFYEKLLVHAEDIKAEGYERNALEEALRTTQYCIYGNNVVVNAKIAFNISQAGRLTAGGLDNNYVAEKSPLDKNYQLVDKAAKDALPDWEDVPFEKMGLTEK